jgi:hypothetical protein
MGQGIKAILKNLNHSNYEVNYQKEGDQGTKSRHMTKKSAMI